MMRASLIGVWRSLVARFVRDEEVAGSNPVSPTIKFPSFLAAQRHLDEIRQHFIDYPFIVDFYRDKRFVAVKNHYNIG